jgi:hypothetical protein
MTSILADFFRPPPHFSFKSKRESLIGVAIGLESGLSLAEALEGAINAPFVPFQRFFASAAQSLQQGLPPHEVFTQESANVLPGPIRGLLGSGLTDPEKGTFLAHLIDSLFVDEPLTTQGITVALVDFLIVGQCIVALVMFVLPQFREIALGMQVDLPLPMQLMLIISDGMINWWFVVIPVFFFFVGGVNLVDWRGVLGGPGLEIVRVLRLMQGVPRERHLPILETVAHPLLQPRSHRLLRTIKDALVAGTPIDRLAQRQIGLPADLAWALQSILQGSADTGALLGIADLYEQQIVTRRRQILTGVEFLLVFGTASVAALATSSVFMGMISILETALR